MSIYMEDLDDVAAVVYAHEDKINSLESENSELSGMIEELKEIIEELSGRIDDLEN